MTRISSTSPGKSSSNMSFRTSARISATGASVDKLELLLAESLRVAHQSGALRTKDLVTGHGRYHGASPRPSPSRPMPSSCTRRSGGLNRLARKQHYYEEAIEPHQFVKARTTAEVQFAVNRVRQVRVALIEHTAVAHKNCERPLESALKTDGVVSITAHDSSTTHTDDEQIQMLLQIDRYERRALSRRKKALRALIRY
jgi:hypothetical protein